MSVSDYVCTPEKIVAFIDGELNAAERAALEEHLNSCETCATELRVQRQFICELDSALTDPFQLAVPKDFAQVVAVRAESDMRGVRDRSEHKRALLFSGLLAAAAFILLGASTSQSLLRNTESIIYKVFGILELLAKTVYDAAVGFAVILRVLTGGLVSDSSLVTITTVGFVALAFGLLSLLIARYHRARIAE